MHIRSEPYTHDDDGKRVILMDRQAFAQLPTVGDRRMTAMMRRLEHSTVSRGAGRAAAIWGLCIPVAFFAFRGAFPGTPIWAPMLVMFGVGLVACPLLYRWFLAKEADRIVKVLLEDGICPSCAYNFAGLDRSRETIACPECGGAWLTSRVQRAEEFTRGARPIPRWGLKDQFMRRRRWAGQRTTDDRGRRVEMVDRALRGADVDDDADHSHRLARARPELARIGRPARVFAAGFFILLGVLVTASLAGLFASGGPGAGAAAGGTLVGAFCAGGFMVFLGLAIYNGPFAYPAKSANAVLLKHMLCPSCAARLDQIAPAQDGCTECVECGAAWRVPAPQVGGQP